MAIVCLQCDENIPQSNTLIDGRADFLNISSNTLGALILTDTGSGHAPLTLFAGETLVTDTSAEIFAIAEVAAVPLPAAAWLLAPAPGFLFRTRLRRA